MKKIFSLFFVIFSTLVFCQSKSEETLGYACGYSGSPTKLVSKFDELLFQKKYKSIKALLFSKIPGENFLAVVICRRLSPESITLTELESNRIKELFNSKDKVPVCGGCEYREEIELSKMLGKQENITTAIEHLFYAK